MSEVWYKISASNCNALYEYEMPAMWFGNGQSIVNRGDDINAKTRWNRPDGAWTNDW